jgi:hypothetical protein
MGGKPRLFEAFDMIATMQEISMDRRAARTVDRRHTRVPAWC